MVILSFNYIFVFCYKPFIRASGENYIVDNVDGVCVALFTWSTEDDEDD